MSVSADVVDYPAAHSMDTDWFAVDAEGHVAMFESGENGAVPEDWHASFDYPEMIDLLFEPGGSSILELDYSRGDLLVEGCSLAQLLEALDQPFISGQLLLLTDPSVLPRIDPGVDYDGDPARLVYLRHPEHALVYAEHPQPDNLLELLSDAAIVAGRPIIWNERDLAELFGFYYYAAWFGEAQTYHRQHVPGHPRHIDEFREDVASKLRAQFGITSQRFSAQERIEVTRYFDCITW